MKLFIATWVIALLLTVPVLAHQPKPVDLQIKIQQLQQLQMRLQQEINAESQRLMIEKAKIEQQLNQLQELQTARDVFKAPMRGAQPQQPQQFRDPFKVQEPVKKGWW